MPHPSRGPVFRAYFDDLAWSIDRAAGSTAARRAGDAWRQGVETHGLPAAQLLATQAGHASRTDLPGCAKTRIPWPSGPWGAVFVLTHDSIGIRLSFLAFGGRHPELSSSSPSVYQRAHRRLHASD